MSADRTRTVTSHVTEFAFRGFGGFTSNEGEIHLVDEDVPVVYLTALEHNPTG